MILPQKTLANTDLTVSTLGLGTVKFGRNEGVKYPHAFVLPTDAALKTLLHCAQDLGINLLDTAPAYGNSEERLGELIGHQRRDWIISSKVGEIFENGQSTYNFTPEYAEQSIAQSLKKLKTDYIDILLVHSDGNDVQNIQQFGILDFLADMKQKGIIRAFGMSTKTVEGGLLALQTADVVMVAYNPIDTTQKPVLQNAAELNKSVFIKKALASGHLNTLPGEDPVKTTLQFIAKEPGVTSIIIGTLNPQHLTNNASALQSL